MAKVSKKVMKASADYRDEIRSACYRLTAIQERYRESGKSPLGRPYNSYKGWTDHLDQLEVPEVYETEDPKYLKLQKSLTEWSAELDTTRISMSEDFIRAEIVESPAKDPPEQSFPKLEEAEVPKLPKPGDIRKQEHAKEYLPMGEFNQILQKGQAKEAYLEDMFIFQGGQILQVYGTLKIVELFARILSHEHILMNDEVQH